MIVLSMSMIKRWDGKITECARKWVVWASWICFNDICVAGMVMAKSLVGLEYR